MHETTLLKIALCCVLLGLPVLYILADSLSLDNNLLDKLASAPVAQSEFSGTITEVQHNGSSTSLIVQQLSRVFVSDALQLRQGMRVRVKGRSADEIIIASEVAVE